MTVRINTNIAAIRTARQLNDTDRKLAASLERLSTGFSINHAGDNPSGLVISEQMRGQIVGLNQAISNSELATSMVQTAEGALTETNDLLLRIRQLALHAANTGANDSKSLAADQLEVRAAVDSIARMSQNTRFGNRPLLDGTSGISGGAQGEGLTYIGASVATRTAPVAGYQVEVTRTPTRAQLVGTTPLTNANVKNLTLTMYEGGKSAQITASADDSAESFLGKVKSAVQEAGLAVQVEQNKDGYITITHLDYGSTPSFQASSSVAGVISQQANVLQAPNAGNDIAGTIAGEKAVGRGQVLMGVAGNEKTDGLSVSYIGAQTSGGGQGEQPQRRPQTGIVGTVNVVNNSLDFQVGPNVGQRVSVALPTVTPGTLARRVQTASGFHSLADIDVTTAQGARDTVRMVDTAIDEITLSRGQLGSFQRDGLESNINTLRVTAENLTAAESTIRDTDVANELAEYTKQRILLETNSALLAQANQLPNSVVHLIG